MSEESNVKNGKGSTAEKEKSFWKTIPGLLTGIAAIITAISGLLVALSTTGLLRTEPTPTATLLTLSPTSRPADTLTSPVQQIPVTEEISTPPSFNGDCLDEFLTDVPIDRVSTVEVGTRVLRLIAPTESMEDIIALKFEDLRTPLGAMKFYAFPENQIFRIVDIVDANCQRVEEYEPSESADKNTLGYYEDLNLNLSGTDYILLLTFDTSEIYLVHFYRKSP
jgi:hypothetical protein